MGKLDLTIFAVEIIWQGRLALLDKSQAALTLNSKINDCGTTLGNQANIAILKTDMFVKRLPIFLSNWHV